MIVTNVCPLFRRLRSVVVMDSLDQTLSTSSNGSTDSFFSSDKDLHFVCNRISVIFHCSRISLVGLSPN